MMRCCPPWVCMYIRSLRNVILCLCMFFHISCTIQSYARICIAVPLGQCLHGNEAKMCPRELTEAVWRQVRTADEDSKFFGHLAAYTADTAALVRYTKDETAFVTAKPRARQTI